MAASQGLMQKYTIWASGKTAEESAQKKKKKKLLEDASFKICACHPWSQHKCHLLNGGSFRTGFLDRLWGTSLPWKSLCTRGLEGAIEQRVSHSILPGKGKGSWACGWKQAERANPAGRLGHLWCRPWLQMRLSSGSGSRSSRPRQAALKEIASAPGTSRTEMGHAGLSQQGLGRRRLERHCGVLAKAELKLLHFPKILKIQVAICDPAPR